MHNQAQCAQKRFHRVVDIPDLNNLPPDALLTRAQMAAISGFTDQAFKKWASENRGPVITRVEGLPRYRVADARKWLGAGAQA